MRNSPAAFPVNVLRQSTQLKQKRICLITPHMPPPSTSPNFFFDLTRHFQALLGICVWGPFAHSFDIFCKYFCQGLIRNSQNWKFASINNFYAEWKVNWKKLHNWIHDLNHQMWVPWRWLYKNYLLLSTDFLALNCSVVNRVLRLKFSEKSRQFSD